MARKGAAVTGNICLKTFHDMRGQIVAWSLGLAVLGAANVLVYPTMQNMPGIVAFLDNLPPAFKAMIGDVRDVVRLEGFLRAKLFDPLPLLLAIFVVARASQLIAGEVEEKSVDLLMARPIRRWRVVLEKYLAVVGATFILCGALAVSLLISRLFLDTEVRIGYLVMATFNALPLTWLFAGLAMLGSCSLPRARHAALLAGIVVVASYVFETLRLLSPALSGWRGVSLFAQHKAGYSLSGGLSAMPILALLGITVVLIAVSAIIWERRDLVS
jgi:ABC-2 type transport system permease protein